MSRPTKKILSLLLTAAMVFSLMPLTGFVANAASDPNTIDLTDTSTANGTNWSYDAATKVFTIANGADVTITGAVSDDTRVVVDSDATAYITLNGASIDRSAGTGDADANCAFLLGSNAVVNLTLASGTVNTLKSGWNRAGLQAPHGTTLVIDGTGTLNATGGGDPYTPSTDSAGGAGIGGGGSEAGGTITINNGTINAQGGGAWSSSSATNGAGIGGGGGSFGNGGNSGTITINGGTVSAVAGINYDNTGVPARGLAAGIGGGSSGFSETITITGGIVTATGDGGAGIGAGGNRTGATSSVITINGNAEVSATGNGSAGIGSGYNSNGGTITISGDAEVSATGYGGAGIGAYGNYIASITIGGNAVVTAAGIGGGAGIGSGRNAPTNNTVVNITGGTVRAFGYEGGTGLSGAAVGGGHQSPGGTINISAGTVTAISDSNGYPGGAGIGGGAGATYGGPGGTGGTINITGGVVTARGAQGAAGIGGGSGGNTIPTGAGGVGGAGGIILLSGGTIEATGGAGAAGIGGGAGGPGGANDRAGGDGGATGTVKITGGTIVVAGAPSASDIGGGIGGAGGGTGAAGTNGSGGSVTIAGGSVNAVSKNISPAPTDGTSSLYLATLTVGSPAVVGGTSCTAGSIDSVACDTVQYDAALHSTLTGYGIYGVKTDSTGKVYFWLSEAATAESVSLTAGGFTYSKSFIRTTDNNTTATLTDPTDARLFSVASQTITATGTGTISTSPKTASITVPYSKTSIVAATDIVAATYATMTLYSDDAFSVSATSINLNVGGGNHLYIAIVAENGTTTLYYDITVTRASDTSGGGGGGGATTPSSTITAPTTDAGWNTAANTVNNLKDGESFTINMGGVTTVPGDFFEAIAGKDVSLTFKMGGGMSWAVNGKDIPKGADLVALNLAVATGTGFVPAEVRNIDGSVSEVQLRLSHDGELPFPLTLTVTLDKVNAGYFANLFYYNEETGELDFKAAVKINADGTVDFDFDHASDYLIVVAQTSMEPVQWQNPFADVKTSDWFYGDVEYAVKNGLFAGTSATTFSPNTPMTRGMLVTVLWRAEGSPEVEPMYAAHMMDIVQGAYYEDAMGWAVKEGIISGYGEGLYGPDDSITREQLATLLYRYAQMKEIDVSAGENTNILSYADAFDISEYAIAAFQWACGDGIITGKPGGLLDPQGTATRAEVAAVLHRYLEK